MKPLLPLLAPLIFAMGATASAAVTFHPDIASWRAGSNGGQSSHTAAAERLETFDDVTNGTIAGPHNAVTSTGSPYVDIPLSLAINNTASTTAVQRSGNAAFRTGGAGFGIRFNGTPANIPVTPATDDFTFTVPSVSAFAVNIHDMFDTNSGSYQLEIFVNGALALDTGVVAGIGGNAGAAVPVTAVVAGAPTTFDGSNPAFPAVALGQDSTGPVGDGSFIGFTASPGSAINTVQFVKTTFTAGGDNWGFDHLILVPEPSRALLLLFGCVGILFRRHR